ncbi:MAG: hypothetical protein RLZZ496_592, partial [Pseudomonadota bacterium]
VRMSYADGDQNIFFRDPAKKKILEKYAASGEFSRPEALAAVKEQKLDLKGNVIAETPAQALTDNADASGAAIGNATQVSASTPKADASKSDPSFFEKWFGTTSSISDADSLANTAPVPLPPPRG